MTVLLRLVPGGMPWEAMGSDSTLRRKNWVRLCSKCTILPIFIKIRRSYGIYTGNPVPKISSLYWNIIYIDIHHYAENFTLCIRSQCIFLAFQPQQELLYIIYAPGHRELKMLEISRQLVRFLACVARAPVWHWRWVTCLADGQSRLIWLPRESVWMGATDMGDITSIYQRWWKYSFRNLNQSVTQKKMILCQIWRLRTTTCNLG